MGSIRHAILPHKGYSRDATSRWDNPGRVMVDLEGAIANGAMEKTKADEAFDLDDDIPQMADNGDPEVNKENKKEGGKGKKQLLRQLAHIIRSLPNRRKRCEEKIKKLEEEKLKMIKAEKEKVAPKAGGSSGGGGNRKKKGKKKKIELQRKRYHGNMNALLVGLLCLEQAL